MAAPAAAFARPALDLPPPYSLVTLREAGDAFAHACRIAPETGAGTLVWVRRFDLVEFAVVLEPEEALNSARRAFFVGMNALADSIAAYCPPEREVTFDWPDTIRFDGGRVGGGRLGWPKKCREDETPGWLVFSAMLVAARVGLGDPGHSPDSTSLEEEGFESSDGPALVESFTRHLMVGFDAWSERGFKPVAETYLARLALRKAGERRAIDGNGDLLIRRHGQEEPERIAFLPALKSAAWLDPATGTPRI
jgi:hypothetical protein